jgi:1-deoxy-D-xylulose-5-phosphate reductoisomerase
LNRVTVLGSTGSIGESTLDVLARHPDRYCVAALAARTNVQLMAEQCRKFRPPLAAMSDPVAARALQQQLRAADCHTEVLAGQAALTTLAADAGCDTVMAAISGAAGLHSTLAAASAGKRLLVANKEAVVMAGPLLHAAVQSGGATLIPIDSEHNAIFQCLPANWRPGLRPAGVRRVVLTASGGPFLEWSAEQMAHATPAQACAHPRWNMGAKISVDSATLMNKGLELIEACVLFGLRAAEVDIVVHPQSTVHSLVEYLDGSLLAQLGSPDMRTPIAQALAWPGRMTAGVELLDLVRTSRLDFLAPDTLRFPALRLARAAAEAGGLASTWLNAADEVAVAAFLDHQLNFGDIAAVIAGVMERFGGGSLSSLDAVMAADADARRVAGTVARALGARHAGAAS